MTHRELVRSVARATGESPQTISRLGFSLVPPPDATWLQAARECLHWRRRLRRAARAGRTPRREQTAHTP